MLRVRLNRAFNGFSAFKKRVLVFVVRKLRPGVLVFVVRGGLSFRSTKTKDISGAVVLGQIFRQIVPLRVMTLINSNVVRSRHIKREEILVPVAARHSKTPELNINFIRGNVTHSAQGETAFLRAYCSLRNEMGRNEMEICSLRTGNL